MPLHLAGTVGSRQRDLTGASLRDWAHARPRLASLLLSLGITVLGSVLAYLRVPPVSARTVWAEDGRVFLQEYLAQGPGLLNPYDGYLHLLPRSLVAVVVPVFGIEAYPLAITVACSIALGLIAALVFHCSSALSDNTAARLCWASIPILVAPGALETMANVANLHWYLLWLAPWVLMKSPSAPWEKILLGATALAISLTEIQAALFLPLVFFRWKDRNLLWAKAGLVVGIACQLVTLRMYPRTSGGTGEQGDFLSVVYGYFLNTSSALIDGSSAVIGRHVSDFGALPVVLCALPFAAAIGLLCCFGTRDQLFAGATWLLASIVLWSAAVVINPAPYFHYARFDTPQDWAGFFLSRYSTVPSMFLLALLPLLIARRRTEPATARRWGSPLQHPSFRWGVVAAFAALQTMHFFPIDAARTTGPEWAAQVQAGREACAADPALDAVQIVQAPDGWLTTLSCADL